VVRTPSSRTTQAFTGTMVGAGLCIGAIA
jgi:hypothetical protein